MGATVIGIGTSLPEKVLTNDDLAAMMDTSDEWIRERTGVRERRIGLPTSTMSIESGRAAMEMAGVEPEDVGLLILATTTPDQRVPGDRGGGPRRARARLRGVRPERGLRRLHLWLRDGACVDRRARRSRADPAHRRRFAVAPHRLD